MSHYVHHVPGRLRVKTAVVKRNRIQSARLQELLTEFEGVVAHEVNIVTGSILISYDAALTDATIILSFLKEQGYIEKVTTPEHGRSSLSGVGSSVGKAFGKAVFDVVVEKAVQRALMAVVL